MQIFALLSFTLVALATADDTTTAQPPTSPECPNLSLEERKKLEEIRFHDFDPHYNQIGTFYEVLGPKVRAAADGSKNCVTKTVKQIDDNKLRQSVTVQNTRTGNEKTIHLTYEKIKPGVYLIRTAEKIAIAKYYIIKAEIGFVASFVCSLEHAANGISAAFGELKFWMGFAKPDDSTPHEKPLPKMSMVFVADFTMTPGTLHDHVDTAVKEIKEQMSKDVSLFGPIEESKTCKVKNS